MKTPPVSIVVVGACALLLALTYAMNPFHTASLDPRIRVFGVTLFRAPSRSMEPTVPQNSTFVVSAWPYLRSDPQPGDVVVFEYPLNPTVVYVKRIIAAGGSTIEIADGVVLVDDRPLAESYVSKGMAVTLASRSMRRVRVPPMSYFVMGDNRDQSEDSRVWGFVPRDHIVGEVASVLPP